MRYLVIAMFVLIVLSLASALVFVYRDESGSKRAVKALTIRVALSMGLFLLLMAAYLLGWIPGRL
ncbi:MAG: twin transmembrane helix small protein [Burkholderiales bacterium]